MALASPVGLWKFARAIERVFDLDRELKASVDRFAKQFEAVEASLGRLEAEQRVVRAEAASAAVAAGSSAAAMHTAELARQIGVLQEQVRTLQSVTGMQPGLATT